MRPLTVIVGIMFGSLFSIAFSLCAVMLVFWVLQDDHPRFRGELPELARGSALFSAGALIAGAAFIGALRQRAWRYPALLLLMAMLSLIGFYYWPD